MYITVFLKFFPLLIENIEPEVLVGWNLLYMRPSEVNLAIVMTTQGILYC